jgi:hypothetical protein
MEMGSDVRKEATAYTLALCQAITSCKDLQRVLELLKHAANTLLFCSEELGPATSDAEVQEEVQTRHAALMAAVAAAQAAVESRCSLLRQEFYGSAAFDDLAKTLLSGRPGKRNLEVLPAVNQSRNAR